MRLQVLGKFRGDELAHWFGETLWRNWDSRSDLKNREGLGDWEKDKGHKAGRKTKSSPKENGVEELYGPVRSRW